MTDNIDQVFKEIPGKRILDIATGKGGSLAWLVETMASQPKGIGIDNGPRVLEAAKAYVDKPNLQFARMDAARLGFSIATFDVVNINNSLHHLDNPEEVLREMYRVLRPGGYYIISEMVRDGQTDAQLTHVKLHHWWAEIDRSLGIPHYKTLTREEIMDLAKVLNLSNRQSYEYVAQDHDPFDKALQEELNLVINLYLERAKKLPHYPELETQGEALRERLKTIGLAWATQLILIGCK